MFNKQYTAIMQYGIYCREWQVNKYSSHAVHSATPKNFLTHLL